MYGGDYLFFSSTFNGNLLLTGSELGAGITTSGLGDQDYGFRGRVSDLEVHGYMFGVASYGFRVRGYLLRLKGSGLGVKCSRFRVRRSRLAFQG